MEHSILPCEVCGTDEALYECLGCQKQMCVECSKGHKCSKRDN